VAQFWQSALLMQGSSILVVEDNTTTRRLVCGALRTTGLLVREAGSGQQALDSIGEARPDLVLLDLALPDVDGVALLDRLRLLAPGLAVVAFTGRDHDDAIRAAGFDDVLMKPVDTRRVVDTVRSNLRRQELAIPRTTTRDRAWNAMTSILGGLTELAAEGASLQRTVRGVLESLLDASGFAFGLAWSLEDGALLPCTHVGFTAGAAAALSRTCEAHPAFAEAFASRDPLGISSTIGAPLFEGTEIQSAILIPLRHGPEPFGMIVMASMNPFDPRWLDLVRLMIGPVTQSLTLASTVARLSASEHRFRGIAETTADGILLTGNAGRIKYLNASAERILGRSCVGEQVELVMPFLANGDCSGNVYETGTRTPVDVSQRTFEDPPGIVNRVYVLRDLSHQAQIDKLAHLANHDVLTGLCNRRRFREALDACLSTSSRHEVQGAVLVIDLDQFKPINDRYGHHAGDRVLEAVGALLAKHTRSSDMAARLGGDEFAMLLGHTDSDGAEICAARVLAAIRELEVPFEGHTLTVGASIGIATFPARTMTSEAILVAADAALYRAKRAGRDGFARSDALALGTSPLRVDLTE
jgi:diguanylate cyclase (GGDEF)-like protein